MNSKKVSITIQSELYNQYISNYNISGIINTILTDIKYHEDLYITPPPYLKQLMEKCKKE